MEKILEKIFNSNENIDIHELANMYYKIKTPFTGLIKPDITYESWQYAIKHLPLSIFIQNNNQINYILHLPGDYYDKESEFYSFSGWLRPRHQGLKVYADENIKCECRVITEKCCEIHINMRDIYTDI